MWVKNNIWNILFLVVVAGFAVFCREEIGSVWSRAIQNYFPCRSAIEYRIETFDARFGLSKEEFLSAVQMAEDIWEKPIGKNLFEYDDGGELRINLVYDQRQHSTFQLQDLSEKVENSKAYYDLLKTQYENIKSEYESAVASFEARVKNFNTRSDAYEAEVRMINRKGGANQTEYQKLNAERDYLNQEAQALNQLQSSINAKINQANQMVQKLNELATSLNLDVSQYNKIGDNLGVEFDEGLYKVGPGGQEIFIYQFENKTKLVRVLAHELGHALGLDHVDDPKAIMYRLNIGTNEKLSQTDLDLVKKLCSI
jgi:predicted  nucleic acid-binding Zn-ribbon protein